ncbi:hypothetical protein DVA80_20745, partial [Acinetobacter baumannii]|uniref:hypothetical protein n=1 Tax=Acinetobacter baumannii TaxID=470 RepID=UPI000DF88BCB
LVVWFVLFGCVVVFVFGVGFLLCFCLFVLWGVCLCFGFGLGLFFVGWLFGFCVVVGWFGCVLVVLGWGCVLCLVFGVLVVWVLGCVSLSSPADFSNHPNLK